MRSALIFIAVGAALSSILFLLSCFLVEPPKADRKPYLTMWDNRSVPYTAEDNIPEAVALGARRSARIAYKCGAKAITNSNETPDSPATITVSADEKSRWVTDCIQDHSRRGEIDVRYVWLTDRELIF